MALKYRIGTIGWYSFETLVQTLLKGVIGTGVTSFGGTKDGGRDAEFTGRANYPSQQTQWDGWWIMQVKYADLEQGAPAARRQIKGRFKKEVSGILQKHTVLPENYIFITNVPLTAANRKGLATVGRECGFHGNFACIDGKEICEFLDLLPQVRRSYPQLLGLADLDHILNRELYQRSEAYVLQWQPRLAAFVPTLAYGTAVATLREHHFVVLDGPPEAGKSTIGAALTLMYAALGYEVVAVRRPEQVFQVYAREQRQLFVADDAVGSLSFNPLLGDDWSRDLPGILAKLDSDHLLIWTTRAYILKAALSGSRLGETLSDFPGAYEVLVEVGELSLVEKAQILYNHAKHGHLCSTSRALVRERASEIVSHRSFTPERIRQLVDNVLPKHCESAERGAGILSWREVEEFLRNPATRWTHAYLKLSESEQALLEAVLDLVPRASAQDASEAYSLHCARFTRRALPFEDCLDRIDHSFLQVTQTYAGERSIEFAHPSLRDMLFSQIMKSASARQRYIQLASPVGLARVIRGIDISKSENARVGDAGHVLVPKPGHEFGLLIGRLSQLPHSPIAQRQWRAILTSADLLLPRAPPPDVPGFTTRGEDGFQAVMLQMWNALKQPTKVPAAEIDLAAFRATPKGRVLCAVADAFGCQEMYESNHQYDLDEWAELLRKYYGLAEYVVPRTRPAFLSKLLKSVAEARPDEGITCATIIHKAEPLLFSQVVGQEVLICWHEYVEDELSWLTEQANDVMAWSDDAYEGGDDPCSWQQDAERMTGLALLFYAWAPFERPGEYEELLDRISDIQLPDPDLEYHGYDAGPESDYWTIERMFADL